MIDFTEGKERKVITQFTTPIIIGSLFMQLYNIVNGAVVGHFLGKEALAAVGAAFPIIFLLVSIIIGVTMGGTVLVSQFSGAKDWENVRKSVDTSYIFLFVSGFIMSIIGIVFAPEMFIITNLPKDIFEPSVNYLRIFLSGLIFMFAFNAVSAVLRGLGDSKTPVYYLLGSNILNLILSILFICVFRWGVEASAWASVISQMVAFFIMNYHVSKKNNIACVRIKNLQWDTKIFKTIVRIGLPTGFQQSFVALGQLAIMVIINGYGTIVVAAYGVAMRLDSFASMPSMSFSQAITSFTGQNLGMKKTARIRRGLRSTIKINLLIAVIISLVFVFFGKHLMALFTKDAEVIESGYKYLLICGPFYFSYSIMFIFTGVLRGAGDTLIPMFITLFSLWIIRIPLAYLFSHPLGMGYEGVYWAIPLGWLAGFVGIIWHYRRGKWRNKTVRRRMETDEN